MKQNIQKPWDNDKKYNVYLMGIQEGEESEQQKKYLKHK